LKKVLFITYYWPPSGKASIHWPLQIIKHLPSFGWSPSVLTAREDVFSHKDESLFEHISPDLAVLKTNSIEPFNIYRKFTGKGKDEVLVASETISTTNKGLAHRLSIWIRMNLFIPDARAGWYFPAVSEGTKFLKKYPHDAVVTIGPPHTAHLIGMSLAGKFNIPHYPVLIDPWTDIVYYRDFKRSAVTKAVDNYLEKKVMKKAGKVIFVTNSTREDYINKYSFLENKSHVLYWGFNEENFKSVQVEDQNGTEVLVHAGNIFDYQNPQNFWRQLKIEIDKGRKLKIVFVGSVSPGIKKEIEQNGLLPHTEYKGFLPYTEMVNVLAKANYLLVCATEKRHVPGKLFEYLRIGKPILAFGDDNDEVNSIIKNANAGMVLPYSDSAEEFFQRAGGFKTNMEYVRQFDRKNIACRFAGIMDEKELK
jgi:glycosyltransferase involved in cell wall biosynthesis